MRINKSNGHTAKKVSLHRVFIGLVAILCVTSGIIGFAAINKPLQRDVTNHINTIEEKLSYDYSIQVKRSELYPKGGIVKPDSLIFTNLTDQLILELSSTLHSEEPVRIEANTEVFYRLVATNMWEREYKLLTDQSISQEGDNITLMEEDLRIDLDDMFQRISLIEEETLVRPNGYQIIFLLTVSGNVLDKEGTVIHEIDNQLAIPFELTGQYIKFIGEVTEKEFIQSAAIEEYKLVPQTFVFFGYEIDVMAVRLCSGILFLLTLLFLLRKLVKRIPRKSAKSVESDQIDKKYKSKIIEINDKISLDRLPHLGVKSFQRLMQIAEEKEEPVLKYTDGALVFYYVFGNSSIYYYGIENITDKGPCDTCLNVL